MLLGLAVATVAIRAADVDDGWNNLRQITRERSYGFVTRDGKCYDAAIRSVNDRDVQIHTADGRDLVLLRADILRVSDYLDADQRDTVYSGRSSWDDLHRSMVRGSEYLIIVTKQGEELRSGRRLGISRDWVSIDTKTIEKSEVQFASYVRYEPLTRWEQNVHHAKMDLFAPKVWFRGAFLKKIPVLMYNAILPEDNSTVRCIPP
jgi:hypothetical protein